MRHPVGTRCGSRAGRGAVVGNVSRSGSGADEFPVDYVDAVGGGGVQALKEEGWIRVAELTGVEHSDDGDLAAIERDILIRGLLAAV